MGQPVDAAGATDREIGYGQDEHVRRCHEAGFDSHLTKPVAATLLKEVLAQTGDRL